MICARLSHTVISLIMVRLHTLYRCVKIHSQRKLMIDLTLSLGVEIDSVKFNITYYPLAWCNGSTVVF